MKAVVAAFNQEKALVGAFSVITNLRMQLFEALAEVVATTDQHLTLRALPIHCPIRDQLAAGAGSEAGEIFLHLHIYFYVFYQNFNV